MVLYVQEVATLQKKTFNLFATENEVYTIYSLLQYFKLNIIRLQSKIILGPMNSIGWNNSIKYLRSGHYFLDIQYEILYDQKGLHGHILIRRYQRESQRDLVR